MPEPMAERPNERLSDKLAGFEAECRKRGLAVTIQRRTVFEALSARRDHPTADQVYDAVKGRIPGLSPHHGLPRARDPGRRRASCARCTTRAASRASTR